MSRYKEAKKIKTGNLVMTEKILLRLDKDQVKISGDVRREAARCWNAIVNIHRTIFNRYGIWLTGGQLKEFFKGRFQLHSQSVQALVELYEETCRRTKDLKKNGETSWRYPWRKKHYFTVTWKNAAISFRNNRICLSNGRGREPLEFKLPARIDPAAVRQAQLVWKGTCYWLHLSVEKPVPEQVTGFRVAGADPGEVHSVALTDGSECLVISGRLLRSWWRLQNKELGKYQRKLSRLKKGSRRWRKLTRKKRKFLEQMRRRKEHLLHTITARAAEWCFERGVKTLYIGNPLNVTKKNYGRRHNQRMHQWTFGQMFNLLKYKLAARGIEMVLVGEENTSSTCPSCGAKGTLRGRTFHCPECGFSCHRDVVGGLNIRSVGLHGEIRAGQEAVPKTTYLRPAVLAARAVDAFGPGHRAA
ncbi:MAG: IS200/IS605 family element transposase accessory protein TnpB [Thermoanaerobacteraceae bacterium]|nr:IS200/IS605 family element transposase accessory protein TnpB [Thermoanaerobacteraceae bacterium]